MNLPVLLALLWVGNNVRMMRSEKRPITLRGALLGPLVNFV